MNSFALVPASETPRSTTVARSTPSAGTSSCSFDPAREVVFATGAKSSPFSRQCFLPNSATISSPRATSATTSPTSKAGSLRVSVDPKALAPLHPKSAGTNSAAGTTTDSKRQLGRYRSPRHSRCASIGIRRAHTRVRRTSRRPHQRCPLGPITPSLLRPQAIRNSNQRSRHVLVSVRLPVFPRAMSHPDELRPTPDTRPQVVRRISMRVGGTVRAPRAYRHLDRRGAKRSVRGPGVRAEFQRLRTGHREWAPPTRRRGSTRLARPAQGQTRSRPMHPRT